MCYAIGPIWPSEKRDGVPGLLQNATTEKRTDSGSIPCMGRTCGEEGMSAEPFEISKYFATSSTPLNSSALQGSKWTSSVFFPGCISCITSQATALACSVMAAVIETSRSTPNSDAFTSSLTFLPAAGFFLLFAAGFAPASLCDGRPFAFCQQ